MIEPTAPPAGISVSPAVESDRDFLFRVYACTRRDELVPLGWDDDAITAFLRTRFEHELRDWRMHHRGSECLIVEHDGRRVGRMCVARSEHEIRLMDISLLPEHRGRGIGTALLQSLLDEARRTRRTVCATVQRSSPFVDVCRALGFLPAATRGSALLMEWTAEARA